MSQGEKLSDALREAGDAARDLAGSFKAMGKSAQLMADELTLKTALERWPNINSITHPQLVNQIAQLRIKVDRGRCDEVIEDKKRYCHKIPSPGEHVCTGRFGGCAFYRVLTKL